jgi:hypothetical protein
MQGAKIRMIVSLLNSYVEILTQKLMTLVSGALGRSLGQRGGALMNGISALLKGFIDGSFTLLPLRQ